MAKLGKPKGGGKLSITRNTVKLFHKNIVEGKSITRCAEELGLSRKTLHEYKKSDDYRNMALEHLENSTLKGLSGTISKLVKALDAKRPVITDNADGSTNIKMVADQKTQMTALDQVIRIYGLHAPVKKDVTTTISITSDAELFGAIEQAERACRFVQSEVKGKEGFSLVAGESSIGGGDVKSRQRALLLDAPVPEPV